MLAVAAHAIPTGPAWAHEVKWDGMRLLADVHAGQLRLTSRAGNDATVSFPELAGLAGTYEDLLLDGEVVALDQGRPSFTALAERMHVSDPRRAERLASSRPVTFMVFDLLRLFGTDLTAQPWSERRKLLESLALSGPAWQVPPVYDDGQQLFRATRDQGLEGIVSKRRSSPYAVGRRSADWLKSAHRTTYTTVVGGWRPETGTTNRLGAVLLGLPAPGGGWSFAGRMGSGIAGKTATTLLEALAPLTVDSSPFVDTVPALDARGATWVAPRVVVEARALELTDAGRLRQPAYLGMRTDLTAADLLADAAAGDGLQGGTP